jgi:hypothetical protein
MCIGGRLGLVLNLVTDNPVRGLFGETNGCLLVEVSPAFTPAFESLLDGLPILRLGHVADGMRLSVTASEKLILDLPVDTLVHAWKGVG